MTVDDALSDKIPAPMPNHGGFRLLVVGPPGVGKTNWTLSHLLPKGAYNRVFSHVHVVMPPNSRASFAKDPFEGHNQKRMHGML